VNARLSLGASALKGLLALSLRDQDAEPLRRLNATVGKLLARAQSGNDPGADGRAALRDAMSAAQSQLDALMLSPRTRALAAFLQAVLQEEVRG
jgi:hypothetical protein